MISNTTEVLLIIVLFFLFFILVLWMSIDDKREDKKYKGNVKDYLNRNKKEKLNIDKSNKFNKKEIIFSKFSKHYSYSELKGRKFEEEVGKFIFRKNSKTSHPFFIFVDSLFQFYNYDNYFQVDLIVITISGIYILELKDYSGKLYGTPSQKNWKVYYKSNRIKNIEVYNAINQNRKHVASFIKKFEYVIENIPVYDFVLISNNTRLCDSLKNKNIYYIDEFMKIFREKEKASDNTNSQSLEKIFNEIKGQLVDTNKKEIHLRNINKLVNKKRK
jgi:hypothetical protein